MRARPPPNELIQSAWFPLLFTFASRAGSLAGQLPVNLSSWFRDAETNLAEEGDPESQHLFGLAADFVGSPDALASLVAHGRRFGLLAFRESDHAHVQLFPKGALARAGVVFPE